ncbi:MAG: hypothetical protein JOZ10_03425 [Acidobacteria bacterium]|nr:hypothetical protein [Acidobacteriota bacterium]MBV9145503.1 hypothetical protein [Acidobacteriota bacterium]MBV9436320.1 hypothetical protein [Acidobacteriota bacterium]
MLSDYKEIFYGIAFGVGAAALDTVIDARGSGESFAGELMDHPGMILYRGLFVLFGLLLGWLLWKNHKRERDLRHLKEEVYRLGHEYDAYALVLHTNLQLLLTKNLQIPADAESLLRSTYDKSRELQALTKQRPHSDLS